MAYGKSYTYTLKFNADINNIRQQMQDLMNELSTLVNSSAKNMNFTNLEKFKAAQVDIMKLSRIIQQSFNIDTNKFDLTKFQRQLAASNMNAEQLANKFHILGIEGDQAFKNLAISISKAETPAFKLNGILDNLWFTMKNTMRWQLSSSMLHAFIGTVQTAWRYTQDLNESLNSIRIVTGASIEEMSKFAQEANKAAQALNTTTVDYTNASLIYYQQGLDTEEVKERTKITIDAANAAGISAEQMSEYLTAVWNSYQVATDQLERYVDKMAAVGANTATSLEEISNAMVNVASTANTVGVNMDQLTAIISTVASTTRQSADTIGTAYKTIFARIGDLKLGETLEDGLELGDVSSQLKSIGIDILDVNGDLRDMGVIVEEIGEKWQAWTIAQQTAVAQAIAGKRQYTQLIALFDNWDAYQNALNISENSEGTLARQAETFSESWEAARKNVKAAAEGIYDSLIDDKLWINFDKTLAKTLNLIEQFIDSTSGFGGIISNFIFIFTTAFGDKLANGLRNARNGLLELTHQQEEYNQEVKNSFIQEAFSLPEGKMTELSSMSKRLDLLQQYEKHQKELTDQQRLEAQLALKIFDIMVDQQVEIEQTSKELEKQAKKYDNLVKKATEYANQVNEDYKKAQQMAGSSIDKTQTDKQMIELYNISVNELAKRGINFGVDEIKAEMLRWADAAGIGLEEAYKRIELHVNSTVNMIENISKIPILENEKEAAANAINEAKILELAKQRSAALAEIKQYMDAINKIKDSQAQKDKTSVEITKEQRTLLENISKLLSKINLGTDTKGVFKNSKQDINGIIEQVEEFRTTLVNVLSDNSSTWEDIKQQMNGLVPGMEKVVTATKRYGTETEEAKNRTDEFKESLAEAIRVGIEYGKIIAERNLNNRRLEEFERIFKEKLNPQNKNKDWADTAITTVQNISSVTMALNSLTNIYTTLKTKVEEGNFTFKDFVSIMMSVSMVLPTVMRFSKNLGSIFLQNAFIFDSEGKAIGINTATKGVAALITKKYGDAELTAAAKTEILAAAQKAAFGIIAVGIVAIMGLVAIIDHFTITQEEASEAIKASIDKYEQEKQKVDELTNSIQSLEDRIKELNEQGSLTIAEQEELDKLKEEILLLEQQKQLQEDITKAALAASAKEIVNKGNKANSFTSNLETPRFAIAGSYITSDHLGIAGTNIVQERLTAEEYREKYIGLTDEQIANLSDTEKESYKDRLETYQDFLQQEKDALNKYLYENSENIANAESNFRTFMEAVNSGAYEATDEEIAEQLKSIREVRMSQYGNNEALYQAAVIIPKFTSAAFEDEKDEFYRSLIRGNAEVSESFEKTLRTAGISTEEFIEVATERLDSLQESMSDFMSSSEIDEFLDSISPSDLDLLFTLDFTGIHNFEEFYRAFLNLKKNPILTIDFKVSADKAREALKTLAGGKFLDEDTIKELKKQFEGLYDFSNLEDLSMYDQASAIGEALIMASDPLGVYNQQLDELKQRQSEINQELITRTREVGDYTRALNSSKVDLIEYQNFQKALMEKPNSLKEVLQNQEKIRETQDKIEEFNEKIDETKDNIDDLNQKETEIDVDIKGFEDKIKEIGDVDPIQIEFEIDTALVDAVVGKMGALEHAASLIGEGFKVEAKDVEELIKTMPELLEDAIIDTETGMLQLQENIVNKVAETAEDEVNITAEGLKERLTNRYNETQDEIDFLNLIKASAYQAQSDELTSAEFFNNLERKDKIRVTNDLIKARMHQSIQEGTQSAQSASNMVQDQNKIADAAVEQGDQAADAWRQTAVASAEYFYAFAKSAVQYQNDIVDGNEPSAKSLFEMRSAITRVGRSGEFSKLSWSYNTSAGSKYAELNKFLKNDFKLWEEGTPEAEELKKVISQQFNELGYQVDAATVSRGTDIFLENFLSGNYATIEDFIKGANASLNDQFNELGIIGLDLSKLLSGINASDILKKSGLKDSKDGKDPKTEEGSELDPKEVEERYHEINALIEEQERLLKDVQTQIDRTYGSSKLKEYNKEQEKLLDLIDSQQEKLKQAKKYAEEDAKELRKLELNPVFSEDGRILNYTELLQQAAEDYNNFVEEWNSHQNEVLTPDAEGNYSESWQKQHEKEKEDVEEFYNKRIAALKQFEETIETYWDSFNEYEQYMRDFEDNKLNKIAYILEFQIDYKDAKKTIRDLAKTIEESTGDALDNSLKVAAIDFQNMRDELGMQGFYEDNINKLLQEIEEAKLNKYIDQEELVSQLENLRDNIADSAEALIEWAESIEKMVPDAIDAAREKFDQFTNQLEHNTSIIDTIKEIMVLQGLTIKTAQGYNDMRDLYTKRMNATLAQAKLNRQWYDNALKELQIAQAELDNATQGTEQYDILKANRDALLEEFNSAQEAMLESAKETIETAREMYVDSVERTVYELEQVLTKGDGFDLLQDKYDHYIDTEERYLDAVNKIYETTKLNNKLQEQIDKTTNAAHAKRLKELQEEFQLREQNNELSEYDIEIMNAKLQMLMKQMELEDAANNKSTLRLVRNSRGNYDYQFTVNPDNLNSINQEYLDAAQDYYNIAKDKAKEVSGDIIDTWQEMTEKIKEIYEDETLTVDEREARIAEIRKYYSQKVKDLEAEKQKAIADMNEAGEIVIDDFKNHFAENLDDLSGRVDNFDELFDETINKMNDYVDEFNNKIKEVNDQAGTSYDDLRIILDQVADSTAQVNWRGQEAAQSMWNQISAIHNTSLEYASMADNILAVARAYQELANKTNQAQFNRLGTDFDENTDYLAEMAQYLSQGGKMSDLKYQQLAQARDAKVAWLETMNIGSDYWRFKGDETNEYLRKLFEGPDYLSMMIEHLKNGGSISDPEYEELKKQREAKIAELKRLGVSEKYWGVEGDNTEEWLIELLKKLGIEGYATGGYTGEFDNGKLAILHEKELILNEEDTKNILDAVNLVRGENTIWTNIAKTLDASVTLMMGVLSGKLFPSIKVDNERDVLRQEVNIHAEFPGVENASEIKEALSNIVNNAAQFASQRG